MTEDSIAIGNATEREGSFREAGRAALRILELGAIVVFCLLVWKNAELRRQLTSATGGQSRVLTAGQRLDGLQITDLNGQRRDFKPEAERSLVIVVDPGCGSCDRVLAAVPPTVQPYVLSIGKADATKKMAERYKLLSSTFLVQPPLPATLDRAFRSSPQIVAVQRGSVMRTCATLLECGVQRKVATLLDP